MKNCIVAIIRNEQNLFIDFILHHLCLGFDEIQVFDDRSDPPLDALIAALPSNLHSKVIIRRLEQDFSDRDDWGESIFWDEGLFVQYRTSKQLYLYNLALRRFVSPDTWVAFIDVDEFLFLGDYGKIGDLQAALVNRSFSAIVFDQLLYGHGFNISPPIDDNPCSYLWCAESYYGHGKFFARSSGIRRIGNPHFPQMVEPGKVADYQLLPRASEFYPDLPRTVYNASQVHLKHIIIQSVTACFERRLRSRIGSAEPMSGEHPTWVDRTRMLNWTTRVFDLQLTSAVIAARKESGLLLEAHLRALNVAASPCHDSLSSCLDFDYLRESMHTFTADHSILLFEFFTNPNSRREWLRFVKLPADFHPDIYRSLNADLESLSRRAVIEHYIDWGITEGRRYKRG